MNKLNLIILSITVVVIICIGIYLYKNDKNNQVNTEPFYQATSQAAANPITIANMATSVFNPSMIQITFPSTLTGNLNNTPVVKFNSDMTSYIKSSLSNVGINNINLSYVSDSKSYSNITRSNEGSYMFLLDSLIDGTYQFNVTIT